MTPAEITQHFMGCLSPGEQERMRELAKLIATKPIELQPPPANKPMTHTCTRCGSIAVSYQGGMCLSCTLER